MKQNEIDYLNELNTRNNVSNLNEDISSQNIQISNKTREMQAKMKLLFEKQNAGGIIEDKKEEIIILNVNSNFNLIFMHLKYIVLKFNWI